MAFNTPLTKEMNYVFGRGVAYFAPFDANGVPQGERDLGELPSLTLNVTSEKYEHQSRRSGIAKVDRTVTTSVKFAGKLEFEDFSKENTALFLGGSHATKTQTGGAVTNEDIPNAEDGREYQLGTSSSNPSGVRGVTSVSVALKENETATARVNSATYAAGDMYSSGGNAYIVTTGGAAAGSPPSFDTTAIGQPTTDGAAVVKFMGTTGAWTVTTHYLLAAEAARIGIVSGANLGLACELYYTVKGTRPHLRVDYTRDANSRVQITSAATGAVSGVFRFVADNAEGDNRDLFIASCSIAPNGDLPFITDAEFAKATLDLGINEKDTSTPQVIIDGRVV